VPELRIKRQGAVGKNRDSKMKQGFQTGRYMFGKICEVERIVPPGRLM
jgi:hypothetical protein